MPFHEKLPTVTEKAVESAAGEEISIAEPLQPSPEEKVDQSESSPNVFEIPVETFADDASTIFAEKPEAAEPAPAEVEPFETVQEVQEPIVEPEPVEPTGEEALPVATVATEASEAVETPVAAEQPAEPAETATAAVVAPAPVAEATPVVEAAEQAVIAEQAAHGPSTVPRETQFLINLNNCTAEDLAKIGGIGPVLAQRIIEFRSARGGFKSLKELRYVPGISRKTLREFAAPAPRSLNRLLGVEHNEELTLQEIMRLTSQLKGVAGCILAMSDGVLLTGQLPPHLDQETISVFAPQLFKKVARYTKELRVGQVTRLSVFTDQQPLSIFHAGDIFLVVVHDPRHFSKALLRRCERISQEIARLCRQRAVV
jgi:competence protein ComEA